MEMEFVFAMNSLVSSPVHVQSVELESGASYSSVQLSSRNLSDRQLLVNTFTHYYRKTP